MTQQEVIQRLQAWLAEQCRAPVECRETHISWVWLTPERAYKVHKAVNLGFVDFSTLGFRLQDTLWEWQLNRRAAPRLYVGAWALRLTGDQIKLVALPPDAPPQPDPADLDYVLEMRRFEPGQRFDELLDAGQLSPRLLDELADAIAHLHAHCPAVRTPGLTDVSALNQAIADNVRTVQALPGDTEEKRLLARHLDWLAQQAARWSARMAQRVNDGLLRDVHGDLHLQNICLFENQVTLFDCLEFSARLRSIDLMNDLGFLIMDLLARSARRQAWRLLNRYLQATGDHAGVALLRYFMAYRAMVRIKVSKLSAHPDHTRYLELIDALMHPPARGLIITHGLSGSGKTTVTQGLIETVGAVRLRSDVERRRWFPDEHLGTRYSTDTTELTYAHLADTARDLIDSGHVVVVDATFLSRSQRDRFKALAAALGVPFMIVHCQADAAVLTSRVTQRQLEGHDASQADTAVLAAQLAHYQPLGDDEAADTLVIDTQREPEAWYQRDTWPVLIERLGLQGQTLPLLC